MSIPYNKLTFESILCIIFLTYYVMLATCAPIRANASSLTPLSFSQVNTSQIGTNARKRMQVRFDLNVY